MTTKDTGGGAWQPIESAPKDAVIDLWHPEYGRITDQWWDPSDGFDWPVAGSTHWMPPPEPPLAARKEES